MHGIDELQSANPLFRLLLEREVQHGSVDWIASNSLKVYLTDRLIGEALPEARSLPRALSALFGRRHAYSLAQKMHSLLGTWHRQIAAVATTLPPDDADPWTGLGGAELMLLGILCYLHDVGSLIHPNGTDEQQRAGATDFVLANSPVLCLSDADAAILSSLVNVTTFTDVDQVHDWDTEAIRCRLLAAVLVFGSLLDTGCHRWEHPLLQRGSRRLVSDRILLPHLCVRSVTLDHIEHPRSWRLRVRWWAPPRRRRHAQDWLEDYLRAVCRDAPRSLGSVVPELSLLASADRRDEIAQAFPRRDVAFWSSPRAINQERVVVLRRLLTSNRLPTVAVRATCHWLMVNFVSSREFLTVLPGSAPEWLRDAISRSEAWNWDQLRTEVTTAESAECLRLTAVKMALDPKRYAENDQQRFGVQVARAVAELIRGGQYVPPVPIVEELFSSWCRGGREWRALAAESILGEPVLLGRSAPTCLTPLVEELLRSADAPQELAQLTSGLEAIITPQYLREDAVEPLVASLLADAELPRHRAAEPIGAVLAAAIVLIGIMPPGSEQGARFMDRVADVLNHHFEIAPTTDAPTLLARLASSWGALPRAPLLTVAINALEHTEVADEQSVRLLIHLVSGLVAPLADADVQRQALDANVLEALKRLEGKLSLLQKRARSPTTRNLAERCASLCKSARQIARR